MLGAHPGSEGAPDTYARCPLVGIQLIVEIMDNAPQMTPTEWKALVILAEDANDARRTTWTSVTDAKIIRRIGMTPEAWTNLRGALVRKKLLEIAEPARRGRPAKYRFPDYRAMGHEIDGPTTSGHRSHEETRQLGHGSDDLNGNLGRETHDETGPLGHGSHEATDQRVVDLMTPIRTPLCSSKSLSSEESPKGPTSSTVDTSRTAERKLPSQPPPEHSSADDVADAWAKARANQGMPARASERAQIRSGAAELLAVGQTAEYLTRVACWMAILHPGWADLGRARTAVGAPPLESVPRTPDTGPPFELEQPDRPPCTMGGCHDHDHTPCDRTGFLIDPDADIAARCPCWHAVRARF